jgi:hypothetical protein
LAEFIARPTYNEIVIKTGWNDKVLDDMAPKEKFAPQ